MSALPASPPKGHGATPDGIMNTPSSHAGSGNVDSLDLEHAHVDPLAVLRSADHRPKSVVWRERLVERMRSDTAVPSALAAVRPVAVGLLLLGVALAVGWRLLVTSDPPVEDSIPIVQRNAPTSVAPVDAPVVASVPGAAAVAGVVAEPEQSPMPVVVHVAGAVFRPGLVDGNDQWRVADAIEAAGGELSAADLDRLNLAAFVSDGQRIFVPEVGEAEPVVSGSVAGTGSVRNVGPVNLNTADGAVLETLPGVGPATAATIISHREANGPFATVDALVAVRGIGAATLEQLRDLVVVG